MDVKKDKQTVNHVAELSRLSLSEEEISVYSRQLVRILDYIDKLKKLDISNISPTSHPLTSLKNVFRKDMIKKSLSPDEALANAPDRKDDFFCVPKIIE